MFDISKFTNNNIAPWVFFGVLCLTVVLTIIVWTKRGVIKDLFVIGYYVMLYFMFVYLYGYVDLLLSKISFIAGNALLKTILNIVAILIVWFIIKAILNRIFKKLFKVSKKTSRAFGFILSLPVVLVFTILLIDLTSPYVFIGGNNLKNNKFTTIYNNVVVEPIKESLFKAGLPVDIESVMINKTYTEKEDKVYAYNAFKEVDKFNLDSEAYLDALDSTTVLTFNKQITYVTNAINTFNKDAMKVNYVSTLTSYINHYEGQTIHLGDQYNMFADSINNSSLEDTAKTQALTIFIN